MYSALWFQLIWPLFITLSNQQQFPRARETLWVAPVQNSSFCENKTEPCKTLTHYKAANMLNRSNVNWKFISGPTPHLLTGGLYVFDRVANVSLLCDKTNDESNICQLKCISPGKLCIFIFVNVTNLSISDLKTQYNNTCEIAERRENYVKKQPFRGNYVKKQSFRGNYVKKQSFLHYLDPSLIPRINQRKWDLFDRATANRAWLFVGTTNVVVSRCVFVGPQNGWIVMNPKQQFIVTHCNFTNLTSGLRSNSDCRQGDMPVYKQRHLVFKLTPFGSHSNFKLVVAIERSLFIGHHYLPLRPTRGTNIPVLQIDSHFRWVGMKVEVTIRDCQFIKCPMLHASINEDPRFSLSIHGNLINGLVLRKFARKWLLQQSRTVFNASAVRLFINNVSTNRQGNRTRTSCSVVRHDSTANIMTVVTISNNTFTNIASGQGSAIFLLSTRGRSCPFSVILVENNNFTKLYGLFYRSVIFAKDRIIHETRTVSHSQSQPIRFSLKFNVFDNNFNESHIDRRCVVYIRPNSTPHYMFLVQRPTSHYLNPQLCYWQAVVYLNGFRRDSRVFMQDNRISNNWEGGVKLLDSTVQLRGNNSIVNCTAFYGGGIKLIGLSQILLERDSLLTLERNRAYVRGGGLFIQNRCVLHGGVPRPPSGQCECFYQLVNRSGVFLDTAQFSDVNANVVFNNNVGSYGQSGTSSMIFNSNADQCLLKFTASNSDQTPVHQIDVFRRVFNLTRQDDNSSKISSIPRKMCMCDHEENYLCDFQNITLDYFPGESLKIRIVVLGDLNIPLSNVLYVDLERSKYKDDSEVYIEPYLHSTFALENKCNSITLPPLPPSRATDWFLQLRVQILRDTVIHERSTSFLYSMIATKRQMSCPDGFELGPRCTCNQQLLNFGINCEIDSKTFIRPEDMKNFWIGVGDSEPEINSPREILWSSKCARFLCNTNNAEVPSRNYDIQCTGGRTGILCGQCAEGLSAVVWSSSCTRCNNWSLLLLLTVIVAVPFLIILIGILNLTVTVGTTNGLTIYFTILVINSDDIPIQAVKNRLNICIYDGMDAFGKTLAIYFLALYLLLLVGLSFFLPKFKAFRMNKLNKFVGTRITPVLATAITYSYLIIAYFGIQTLLYTTLYSTHRPSRVVWLYDGSLDYFQSSKHAILGLMALLSFVLFVLPAAMVATFGDLLRRCITRPYFVNFLDTFHGAFRFRFGFWLGIQLLMLTTIMVFKVLVMTTKIVYLVIICISLIILLCQMLIKPYKGIRMKHCVPDFIRNKYFCEENRRTMTNAVDNLYYFNIVILFAWLLYSPRQVIIPLSISLMAVFLKAILILIYHLLEYTPLGPWLVDRLVRVYNCYTKPRSGVATIKLVRSDRTLTMLNEDTADCWEGHTNDSSNASNQKTVDETSKDVLFGVKPGETSEDESANKESSVVTGYARSSVSTTWYGPDVEATLEREDLPYAIHCSSNEYEGPSIQLSQPLLL